MGKSANAPANNVSWVVTPGFTRTDVESRLEMLLELLSIG